MYEGGSGRSRLLPAFCVFAPPSPGRRPTFVTPWAAEDVAVEWDAAWEVDAFSDPVGVSPSLLLSNFLSPHFLGQRCRQGSVVCFPGHMFQEERSQANFRRVRPKREELRQGGIRVGHQVHVTGPGATSAPF